VDVLLRWLYPEHCVVCDDILPDGGGFCPECVQKMEFIEKPVCVKCGKAVNNESTQEKGVCASCLSKTAKISKNSAVFVYEGEARDAIRRFKFDGRADYAPAFAALLAKEPADAERVVVAVPMHKKKLRKRGYNQAELLARHVAKFSNIPFVARALIRAKNTPPQYGLNYEQRLANVSGAFSVKDNNAISGKSVLLIDDIYTTGATLEACADALLNAGAKDVRGLCLSATRRREV
jgi:ComF family protein